MTEVERIECLWEDGYIEGNDMLAIIKETNSELFDKVMKEVYLAHVRKDKMAVLLGEKARDMIGENELDSGK